jgi:lipopolysaccharide export system permease protein
MHVISRWLNRSAQALLTGGRFLRSAPYVEACCVIAMVVIVLICQWFSYHDTQMPWLPQTGGDIPRGWRPPTVWSYFYHYVAPYLRLCGLLGGIAFHVVLLRAQVDRQRLVLPLWITCGFLALWLSLGDLYEQWNSVYGRTVGQPFSLWAYSLKIALLTMLSLTPAMALSYYQRCLVWERYVLRQVWQPLVFCLASFCSLWIVQDVLGNIKDFQEAKAPLGRVLGFYLSLLPFVYVQAVGPSLLLASLYSLLRLARWNEAVALLGSGLSYARIIRPVLVTAVMFCFVSMAANYHWASMAAGKREAAMQSMKKHSEAPMQLIGVMNVDKGTRRTWFIGGVPVDLRQEKLRHVEIRQFDANGQLETAWFSATAYWWPEGMWSLYRGMEVKYKNGSPDSIVNFNAPEGGLQRRDITGWPETPWSLISATLTPDAMGVPDLAAHLEMGGLDSSHADRIRYETEMWQRLAHPWTGFCMVLCVVPVIGSHSRRGVLHGVGIALALFFGTMFLEHLAVRFAHTDLVQPKFSVWMPHMVMLLFATFQFMVLAGLRKPRLHPRLTFLQAWRSLRGRCTETSSRVNAVCLVARKR